MKDNEAMQPAIYLRTGDPGQLLSYGVPGRVWIEDKLD